MVTCQIDTRYLQVRIERWDVLVKERKQHPSQGDDARTAEGATCRVGRGEQGEALPAINAPRGGPHLDLGRLRLKTWSKFDFSMAGTTWRTLSSMKLLYIVTCDSWFNLTFNVNPRSNATINNV